MASKKAAVSTPTALAAPRAGQVADGEHQRRAPRTRASTTRKYPDSLSMPNGQRSTAAERRPHLRPAQHDAGLRPRRSREHADGLQHKPGGAAPAHRHRTPPARPRRPRRDASMAMRLTGSPGLPRSRATQARRADSSSSSATVSARFGRDHLPGDLRAAGTCADRAPSSERGAHLAALHDAAPPQSGQMLRGAARIELQRGLQLTHGLVAVAQQLEDAHPGGMAENREEVGLDGVNG